MCEKNCVMSEKTIKMMMNRQRNSMNMKKILFIRIKKLIILALCINVCKIGRYGGKQTGERRKRAFCRCFIYSRRRMVKGERNRENEKHYEKIADGRHVCVYGLVDDARHGNGGRK